jgi:hypothetical protein
LDCGAQINLITEELSNKIKENRGSIEENEQIELSGVGGKRKGKLDKHCTITIKSLENEREIEVKAFIIKK